LSLKWKKKTKKRTDEGRVVKIEKIVMLKKKNRLVNYCFGSVLNTLMTFRKRQQKRNALKNKKQFT